MKEVMFLLVSVCLSARLLKNLCMDFLKFSVGVGHGPKSSLLDFGGNLVCDPDLEFLDPDHCLGPGIFK